MLHAFAPLLIPLWTTGFLSTGPHAWWTVPAWLLPMALPVLADRCNWRGWHPGRPVPHPLAYVILGLLAGLFVINTGLLLQMAGQWRWHWPGICHTLADLLAVKFLVGSNAALSGILVAHELIHRPGRFARTLGRSLLILCLYEHFFTEHLRGHHRRVGRPDDPATARPGESYRRFWRRSVPAQFRSAWRLESRRLYRHGLPWWHHRVLQGILAEVSLLFAIGMVFGAAALSAFALQALMAVRNLEAINYLQHWGLTRRPGESPQAHHAWGTDTWCSTHLILGLAHHAHHHQAPGIPYAALSALPESPRLPYGYFFLVFLITYRNERFQALALQELQRRGLVAQANAAPVIRYSPKASPAPTKA
ncbi:MAG TPA: hypothetical protein ENK50_00995 [Sedimenticola sp.]|nr:hypothetical protein [Sedimenticola sp.]